MADNGNRGPNDFRSRNGKRRREPPIIDASATEVDPEAAADAPAEPEPPAAEPPADPVLFGGARRPPEAERATASEAVEPAVVPSALDGEPAPGEPAGATSAPEAAAAPGEAPAAIEPATPPAEPAAEATSAPDEAIPHDAGGTSASDDAPSAAVGEPGRFAAAEPPGPVPPPAALPPSRSGAAAAWLLGVSNLVLLAALAWTLYTAPRRDGHAELAELRSKVAALEARPDASGAQNGVAALDKRLSSADADRAALGKEVAALNARLDAVAQTAQGAKADLDKPAPTGAAAAATVGALAALAARVEGVDKGLSALSADQKGTAKAVADLPKPVPPDFGPIQTRVAAVESQLNSKVASAETQLNGRVTALDGRLTALDARLTSLDGKLNASDARFNGFDAKVNGVDGKVNGFDARMNGSEARTNGLEAKENETAASLAKLQGTVANLPKTDLSPLQTATTGLDKRVGAIEGELSAARDGARATPIALVGQAVARAIADGRPYASDLDALRALGAEPDALAKLQPLAAKGAPTAAALKAQWDAVSGDVLLAVKPSQTGGALDRLGASALSLVQVRQVGAIAGDDAGALVSQVGAALDTGDVAGALSAWSKLPQAGQDRSKDWAAAARSRVEAAAAAQGLVNRAVATLGRTKS